MNVYLIRHVSENRFKIGKASHIKRRIRSLGGESCYDLSKSYCLQLGSDAEALRVETLLHNAFHSWKIPTAESEKHRYPGDDEQFDASCFDTVLKFIVDQRALLNGAVARPIESPEYSPRADPNEKTKRVNFDLPEKTHRKWKIIAAKKQIPLSQMVIEIVEKVLAEDSDAHNA